MLGRTQASGYHLHHLHFAQDSTSHLFYFASHWQPSGIDCQAIYVVDQGNNTERDRDYTYSHYP